jgi:hypothetical protein
MPFQRGRRPIVKSFGSIVLAGVVLVSSGCGGTEATAPVPEMAEMAAPAANEVHPGMKVIRAERDTAATADDLRDLPEAREDVLLIDNFDDGEKPNAIGGNFGAWNRDPLDESQGANEEWSLENHGSKSGLSVRLTYDVESPNPAFNGFWMRLNELDLSGYTMLVVHLKGDTETGFTSRLKIELKNNVVGEKSGVIIEGITDQWTRFRIPLQQFFTINDWTKVSEFVIVFDDELATKKIGAIYMDDIYFVK